MSSLFFFFPFLFPDQKLEPPFVNGNIEKSYKFGAVYPQNFTFSNIGWYLYVLGMDLRYVSTSERFEYTENHTGNWASRGEREERKRILGNSASFSPMRMEIFEKTFDTRLFISAREKPKAVVFGVKKKRTFVLET